MSTLHEEITRLEEAKAAIDEILIAKGVSIPENATLDTYYQLIDSIKTGVSSSEVTATKANVLAGTTTITADSNDEIVEGTMPDYSGQAKGTDNVYLDDSYMQVTVKYPGYYDESSMIRVGKTNLGNAVSGNVLDGIYFTSSEGMMVEGDMPNNGDTSTTIDGLITTSVTIPAGYTSGGTISLTGDIEAALAAI